MHSPTPPAVTLTDGENGRIIPAASLPRLMCPAAKRWTMKSPAVVPACFRPRGVKTRSSIARLIDVPVTASMTRPDTLKPALL